MQKLDWDREKNKISWWTEMRDPINFCTSMIAYCLSQQHLADSRSEEGSSGCQYANNNRKNTIIEKILYFDELT